MNMEEKTAFLDMSHQLDKCEDMIREMYLEQVRAGYICRKVMKKANDVLPQCKRP